MKLALVTCTAVLLGSTTFAGDVNTPAPAMAVVAPVAASTDWSGAYAGGLFAFASGDNIYNYLNFEPEYYSIEGDAYGVFAGYRHDMGNFVLGGEAAILFAGGITETGEDPEEYGYNNIFDLKATAGFDLGNVLVYGTAGYSVASFSYDGSPSLPGWLVGAGVDVKISERFFIGAEYIYRDVNNDDFWDPDDGINGQFSTVQLRAGMTF